MSPVSAVRYVVPLAGPPASAFELPFAACSLYLENPSGVWYDVAGFTVPPWTWGLIVRLDVPAASILVQLLDAPAALVSEDHGGALLVVAYADALMPSVGRSLYPPPRSLLQRVVDVTGSEAGALLSLGIDGPDYRIVPLRVSAHAAVPPDAGQDVRGLVEVEWLYKDPATYNFADQAISPEQVHPPPIELGHIIVPVGIDVQVHVRTAAGAGLARVGLSLDYYRALP